eukprot:5841781-Prymnesium_polylepis.1
MGDVLTRRARRAHAPPVPLRHLSPVVSWTARWSLSRGVLVRDAARSPYCDSPCARSHAGSPRRRGPSSCRSRRWRLPRRRRAATARACSARAAPCARRCGRRDSSS